MSIIGPRPEQPHLASGYRKDIPGFDYRLMVRPGITGWAQVRSGYAANLEETKTKLSFDLWYLKNYSLSLDIAILLRTALTMLTGFGAR